jgi:hypothetical protein
MKCPVDSSAMRIGWRPAMGSLRRVRVKETRKE